MMSRQARLRAVEAAETDRERVQRIRAMIWATRFLEMGLSLPQEYAAQFQKQFLMTVSEVAAIGGAEAGPFERQYQHEYRRVLGRLAESADHGAHCPAPTAPGIESKAP
jgi:hypothetical protein